MMDSVQAKAEKVLEFYVPESVASNDYPFLFLLTLLPPL